MARIAGLSIAWLIWGCACLPARADEPAALNPFGPPAQPVEETLPGSIELSDGKAHAGGLYLTRDVRLKIFDIRSQQHREFPLSAIQQIRCKVQREWMEAEWRFQESASDQKVFTGRSYPVREYVHTIVLRDGRKIEGPLSGIVYLRAPDQGAIERHILYKRQKGPVGSSLKSLVYVRTIVLGESAGNEGKGKSARNGAHGKPVDGASR